MRLRRITLLHFRNVALADLALSGRQQFFLGPNGQGKTSLLEAIGFITALRSFRTADNKLLIAHGQKEAAIACDLEHEKRGETRLVIRLRAGGREVTCDGEKVKRFSEYLGLFPTVVFSSEDQQLVRGAPAGRRRWLDLTLAAMDGSYMAALQNYHRALTGRNNLLRRGGSTDEIEAFEQPMAVAAAELVTRRTAGVSALQLHASAAYAKISDGRETAALAFARDADATTAAEWQALFADNRPRDLVLKTTGAGPHRDDVELALDGRPARHFGSEGQQRSFVLALRLAQMDFFYERSGVQPVLLADDVLGELDGTRRARFWASLGEGRQVIATGTSLPADDLGRWAMFTVKAGSFAPKEEFSSS